MPPKTKSRQINETTPETNSSGSQAALAIKAPPKAKRGKTSEKTKTVKEARGKTGPAPGRGRPSRESQFLQAIVSKSGIHQDVVETVLRAVEIVVFDTLKEKRSFKVSFLQGKLIEKKERLAGEKKVFGKVVPVLAQPAKKNIKFSPTKEFRLLFQL